MTPDTGKKKKNWYGVHGKRPKKLDSILNKFYTFILQKKKKKKKKYRSSYIKKATSSYFSIWRLKSQ